MSNQLALMQLADSFFPSGSFTLSYGLEYLVQTSQVTNSEELQTFLRILLNNKIIPGDLVALLHAYRGSQQNCLATIYEADQQLFKQTLIAQNRSSQQKSGRALLRLAATTWQDDKLESLQQQSLTKEFACLHPVVFATVAEIAGIDEVDTVLAFLHNFVTGILGVSIRLGIVGHLKAQRILLDLAPDLDAAYAQASQLNIKQMWSCTPTIDLAQMGHQKLQTKLFAS